MPKKPDNPAPMYWKDARLSDEDRYLLRLECFAQLIDSKPLNHSSSRYYSAFMDAAELTDEVNAGSHLEDHLALAIREYAAAARLYVTQLEKTIPPVRGAYLARNAVRSARAVIKQNGPSFDWAQEVYQEVEILLLHLLDLHLGADPYLGSSLD